MIDLHVGKYNFIKNKSINYHNNYTYAEAQMSVNQ